MNLQGVTYQGPRLDDPSGLASLPDELIELLWQVNGFVAYAGGLHFRGIVDDPEWHSLRAYFDGEMALSKLYDAVEEGDYPFAQDYLGNQYLLRRSEVWKLRGDTGECKPLTLDLAGFLGEIQRNPIEFLSLELLAEYHQRHGRLEPGRLVHTMPPLCLQSEEVRLEMKSAPVGNVVAFLANFARQIQEIPEGTEVNLRMFTPEDAGDAA